MDFKKLKKATQLLQELEIIDKEIIEIDKMALSIVTNETKIEFDLKVENISKTKKDNALVTIDEDGSLVIPKQETENSVPSFLRIMLTGASLEKSSSIKNKNNISISKQIDDKIALQILGVILSEKNTERENIIKKLNRLGVS